MKKRIELFQVLHGIAILLVFLSHCDHLAFVGERNRLMYLGGYGISPIVIYCIAFFLSIGGAYILHNKRTLLRKMYYDSYFAAFELP